MKLANTRVGQVVTVDRLSGERTFRRRLMELGLVPGTRVELVGVAPLGDPLKFLVRGCSLSIRRSEAGNILVRAMDQHCETEQQDAGSSVEPVTRPVPRRGRAASAT